ncbi:MAG: hypothetical protein WD767_05260 [Alphaproteobacteria bacterium]
MKMFLAGTCVAIGVAIAAGFALNAVEIDSARFNSTENVRL